MNLSGKVALVTGASRGVGAAVAVALAKAGCHVACAARSTEASPQKTAGTLDATVNKVRAENVDGLSVPTNLSQEKEVRAMVQTTLDHFGNIDILINNAAITFVGDLSIALKRHDLVMEVNLRAPLIAMQTVTPHMQAQGAGSILNISSVAALYPHPGLMSYGMSKAGLERLTVDVANQLAKDKIAVNCFRIDIPVASEGFLASAPGTDHSDWEPCDVAAEGIIWTLQQPTSFSGELLSMKTLREAQGIMASKAKVPFTGKVPTTPVSGIVQRNDSVFIDI